MDASAKGIKFKRGLAIFLWVISFVTSASAKEVNFEATVDRNKVSLGSSLQLNFTFNNTQEMPVLQLPQLEGFESRYLGPFTKISNINGQASSSITHIYTLIPVKNGIFNIGPFKLEYKGDTYSSGPVTIEVAEAKAPQAGGVETNAPLAAQDINERIFLVIQPEKKQAYLNEPVPISLKLYVRGLTLRDLRDLKFEHEGFALGEFQDRGEYQETAAGVNYAVREFATVIFGLRPGEFKLGPANLKCSLLAQKQSRRRGSSAADDFFDTNIFDDFFGRYDIYPLELKSREVPITISALPEAQKPENFSGAIGNFNLEVSVGPQEVKVGDPVTLKISVTGKGNFSTVNAPKLAAEENFKIYDPLVKQQQNQKYFEQIIMPNSETISEVPAVSFNFFNPSSGQYQVLSRGPFPLKVLPPDKEALSRIIEAGQSKTVLLREERIGRDIVYIKPQMGSPRERGVYFYKTKFFLWLHIIGLCVLLAGYVLSKKSKRLKQDIRYARKLAAPKKARNGMRRAAIYLRQNKTKEFYDCVFATLQEYLGDKFHLPSQGITAGVIEDILKDKVISEEALNKIREIFRSCDLARYTVSESRKEDLLETLKKLEETIDYLQRSKL
ncbi:MAG: BatD family protein [Candidatus Omnitrophota bacterium]